MRRLLLIAVSVSFALSALGCDQEITGSAPTIGDSETLLATDPAFMCNDDPGSWVTLFGSDFSPLVIDTIAREEDPDVELPRVTLILRASPTGASPDGEFSLTLESPLGSDDGSVRWIDDGTMQFRISSDLELPPGVYDLQVDNPNGESTVETEAFGLIPRPTLYEAIPEMTCVAQGSRDVVLDGSDFLVHGEDYPTIRVGDSQVEVVNVEGCQDLHAVYGGHQLCDGATIRLAEASFEPGVYPVTVQNAEPADCTSEDDVTIRIVPEPVITAIEPLIVCNTDGTTGFTVEGDDLYEVHGVAPQIRIDGQIYQTTGVGCSSVDGVTGVQSCTALEVDVDTTALDGLYEMVAINPEPIGCESATSDPFFVAGPPQITTAAPDGICEDAGFDGDIVLFGQFVFETGGDHPEVTVNAQSAEADLRECETIDFSGRSLQSCTELHTSIDAGLGGDAYEIVVSGASPVACGQDTFVIERQPRPVVTSVIPERICSEGGSLVIQGQDFSPDATVFLDGQPSTTVDVNAEGTSATASFAGPLTGNLATLEFVNPGNCGDTFETEIRIYDGPQPIFVDPPVTFDGMQTQVTIYAAGLYGGSIEEIELIHPDGTATILDFEVDPDRPNIVQAIVPEGMLAQVDEADYNDDEESADFGIRLTDDISCSDEAEGLLTITAELAIALESIEPPFGAQDQSTGVVITATDPLADPDNEVQFEASPRVYLNPSTTDPNADRVAREIRSVQFIDETELNGLVASGLPVGFYDVIVVNPNRTVGVLPEAFQITEERPPLIDGVAPGSWPNDQTALQVIIEGENFRADAEVEVFCRPSGSTETDESLLTQPNSITVDSVTDDLVIISVNTGNLDRLSACYMRLTNTDGTYGEYSPITVTNPAGKFMEFQAGNAFDTARRAPTTFSGIATRTARFLYVIGGDDGDASNAFTSGEFAALDRFGAPRTWRYLNYDLPGGRTLANGERIGDFLYLVGGSDEGAITDEILRAQVLDPLDVPSIVNIDIELSDDLDDLSTSVGLDAGVYYYRVSAVFSQADAANPGGESLASEPQPLRLPIDDISVTISWEPPTLINHDIVEYRIYRSVNPDDPYGNESLLATVDATITSYTDDGSEDPVDGIIPLRLGSLGMWHLIANLENGRQVAGITSAQNPTDSTQYFIYAIGGEDEDGSRADYEFITIDVNGPRDQQVSALATVGQHLLPSPRTELTAVTAHEGNASVVAGVAPQIFVLGGQSDTTADTEVKVATVNADGHLEPWTSLGATRRISGGMRAGHAAGVLNNNLVYLGGAGGSPSADGFHVDVICGGACPPATIDVNFQNLSDLQMTARAWMGYLPFRGFFYLTGGLTTGSIPTNTVDYSVAGGAP